jgi:hypothetical protein
MYNWYITFHEGREGDRNLSDGRENQSRVSQQQWKIFFCRSHNLTSIPILYYTDFRHPKFLAPDDSKYSGSNNNHHRRILAQLAPTRDSISPAGLRNHFSNPTVWSISAQTSLRSFIDCLSNVTLHNTLFRSRNEHCRADGDADRCSGMSSALRQVILL